MYTVPDPTPKIYLMGRDKLPKLDKKTKWLLNLYNSGFKSVRPLLRKALSLTPDVALQKGISFTSGLVYCEGIANLSNTFFVDYAPIYIGEFSGFAFNNTVVTSSHDVADFKKVICKPVIIERNVSITTNVTILGGVRIGENSIIGAGSVVTKDIPPNVFAAGNPCKPIKAINRPPNDQRP